jgi:hypothetical protein
LSSKDFSSLSGLSGVTANSFSCTNVRVACLIKFTIDLLELLKLLLSSKFKAMRPAGLQQVQQGGSSVELRAAGKLISPHLAGISKNYFADH